MEGEGETPHLEPGKETQGYIRTNLIIAYIDNPRYIF